MFWLKIVREIIGIFREGASPHQIAGGFIIGFVIGLTPGWPLHVILLCVMALLLNVNLGTVTGAVVIASGLAWILDPVLDNIGYFLLHDIDALSGLWTALYNNPLVMLTRFNNSLVMGALIVSLISAPIIYYFFYTLIRNHREKIVAFMKHAPILRLLANSRLINTIMRARGMD